MTMPIFYEVTIQWNDNNEQYNVVLALGEWKEEYGDDDNVFAWVSREPYRGMSLCSGEATVLAV